MFHSSVAVLPSSTCMNLGRELFPRKSLPDLIPRWVGASNSFGTKSRLSGCCCIAAAGCSCTARAFPYLQSKSENARKRSAVAVAYSWDTSCGVQCIVTGHDQLH